MTEKDASVEEAPKESNRRKYRDDSWTDEMVTERKAELTVAEVPEGWVKLADVAARYRLEGIPVSRLVTATGGDRCMKDPLHSDYKVVFVGRTRYMPPEALTSGMDRMKTDENFGRKRRKKKADAEDKETGAVKDAKKAPKRRVTASP